MGRRELGEMRNQRARGGGAWREQRSSSGPKRKRDGKKTRREKVISILPSFRHQKGVGCKKFELEGTESLRGYPRIGKIRKWGREDVKRSLSDAT